VNNCEGFQGLYVNREVTMLSEQQIVRAHKLEKEGRTFRKIAEEIGLNPQTQHSQVVSALRYYVMGYEAATRKMESTWTERATCFGIGVAFNMAVTAIIFLI
jgi:uncharacterized protein YerC